MRIFLSYVLLFAFISNLAGQVKVSAGKIDHYPNFPSRYIQARDIDVWLPPGYTDKKKYAVLYMHDGQMLFDASKTWNHLEWGVDETMTLLLKNGQIKETIVVGISNTDIRWL